MSDITPRQQHAHDLNQNAIDLIHTQSRNFFEIGQIFKEIKDEKMWQYMGEGGYDSWKAYLAQPEIYLSQKTVDAYIYIYEVYVERLGISIDVLETVSIHKLNQLASLVKDLDAEQAVEIVEKVRELGARDFNDELKELKGENPESGDKEAKQLQNAEHDLKDIMKNLYNELVGMESSDDVQTVVNRYEAVILKWHKENK